MARKASSKPESSNSTATIGFEATAMRDSAMLPSEATLRSLSEAKDNRWLTTL
jgi:hypothetical protein